MASGAASAVPECVINRLWYSTNFLVSLFWGALFRVLFFVSLDLALWCKMLRRPHNKEGPPVFSHEFVIQNHADIISCVCMVIFIGLIPQVPN